MKFGIVVPNDKKNNYIAKSDHIYGKKKKEKTFQTVIVFVVANNFGH